MLKLINCIKYRKMEFEEQLTDVKLVVDTRPRVYISWTNTEEGRDKKDCYERIDVCGNVHYINTYNRNSTVYPNNPFWHILEKMYNSALAKQT